MQALADQHARTVVRGLLMPETGKAAERRAPQSVTWLGSSSVLCSDGIIGRHSWALEFVPYGIRVNTESPGSILVEGNGWDRYRLANPDDFDDYVQHQKPA